MTADELTRLPATLFEHVVSDDARALGLQGLLDVLATRPGERPEDVLMDLRLVDERDLALSLSFRSGRTFVGLRDFVPDHRLFLYVPLHLAQRERLVPLSLDDGILQLACAYLDPDIAFLRQRFPNLALDLVVSPRREVLEALQRIGA